MTVNSYGFSVGDKVILVKNTPIAVEGHIDFVSSIRQVQNHFEIELKGIPGRFVYDYEIELLEHVDCSKRIGALKDYTVAEDKVNKPNHYQLKDDFEVKHLMELLLDRIEESDKIQFSHFQSSCYKEMMQYLLRCMLKNGYEDIYKARYYLNEVIRVHEERMQS